MSSPRQRTVRGRVWTIHISSLLFRDTIHNSARDVYLSLQADQHMLQQNALVSSHDFQAFDIQVKGSQNLQPPAPILSYSCPACSPLPVYQYRSDTCIRRRFPSVGPAYPSSCLPLLVVSHLMSFLQGMVPCLAVGQAHLQDSARWSCVDSLYL